MEETLIDLTTTPETLWYTLREAATVTGLHRDTIRAKLKGREFPGAKQEGEGFNAKWLIPSTDLGAAGLRPHPSVPETEITTRDTREESDPLKELAKERDEWMKRAIKAEAENPLLKQSLEDYRTIMVRALPPALSEPVVIYKRRGWLRRGKEVTY